MSSRTLRLAAAVAIASAPAACSNSAAPSQTVLPPQALQITCPADQTIQSTTGLPIPVPFPMPMSSGGTPPTQIACTPPSGAVFNIGTTPVSCAATDARSVTASCSFNVSLTVPPKIGATSFVAFGDSMTAGEVRSEGFGVGTLAIDSGKAYPTVLFNELKARYTGQAGAIVVANAGLSGERAVDGANRLPSVIDGGAYSVLLLMEGVNDFPNYQAGLTAMGSMVQYAATRRGMRVYLATEPPENPSPAGCPDILSNDWMDVLPYNDGLRSIAASQRITLVDVYAAFNGDVTTLIGCDGLHPTPAGYQLIADTFFKALRDTLEVPATSVPTLFGFPHPRTGHRSNP